MLPSYPITGLVTAPPVANVNLMAGGPTTPTGPKYGDTPVCAVLPMNIGQMAVGNGVTVTVAVLVYVGVTVTVAVLVGVTLRVGVSVEP